MSVQRLLCSIYKLSTAHDFIELLGV